MNNGYKLALWEKSKDETYPRYAKRMNLYHESQIDGRMKRYDKKMTERFLNQYEFSERNTAETFALCVQDYHFRGFNRDN